MKKAQILSIDATIGLLVALILVFGSLNYMNKAQKEPLPDVQMERMASDIVAVLDYEGLFLDTVVDTNKIQNRLSNILPPSYHMKLEGYYPKWFPPPLPPTDIWKSSDLPSTILPSNKELISGSRIIMTYTTSGVQIPIPGYVRYWIWRD